MLEWSTLPPEIVFKLNSLNRSGINVFRSIMMETDPIEAFIGQWSLEKYGRLSLVIYCINPNTQHYVVFLFFPTGCDLPIITQIIDPTSSTPSYLTGPLFTQICATGQPLDKDFYLEKLMPSVSMLDDSGNLVQKLMVLLSTIQPQLRSVSCTFSPLYRPRLSGADDSWYTDEQINKDIGVCQLESSVLFAMNSADFAAHCAELGARIAALD